VTPYAAPVEPALPGTSPGAPVAPAPPAAPPPPLPTDPRERVLALQVALDRARFSPGEIDGVPGSNHERALRAFAQARNVEATAEAVWAALADGAPTLVEYTVTAEDVAGPFRRVPVDMMAKAKLEKLGYASVEEALAERFHASPALLRRLNPGARFVEGAAIRVPNVEAGAPSGAAARVVVDRSEGSVTAYGAGGEALASYPATMGSRHDPLPIGEWKINGVSRDPWFNYNPDLFWDAKATHAKAKVPPGPNNPVGVVWIDLSKEHYGIHGTPEPATVSKTQSHGCIRLTNWDAEELAGLVSPGTPAVLQD
jgi:lipoprotein-anchoring transpeptidase ErfK/SrfK